MNDVWVNEISSRYIELFEKVTGRKFVKASYEKVLSEVETAIQNELQKMN
jgi:phosphoribosylaminoimidazole-succinocarboxamide synthase